MNHLKSFALAGLVVAAVAALPDTVEAQTRGRAVPRGGGGGGGGGAVRSGGGGGYERAVPRRGPVYGAPQRRGPVYGARGYYRPSYGYGYGYRPYYSPYYYGPSWGFTFGYGGFYGPYAYAPYGFGAYGYGPYAYGPYAYGAYDGGYVRPYGGVRIDMPQKDAEVYADGYYLGIVDDFDGSLQQANLEPGPHRVEVRKPGFETIAFDVNAELGRTVRYRASLRPVQP